MEERVVLEFKNIHKEYPGVHALNNVSFNLIAGEVHALVGENGAGKSTLIKTCSGATHQSSGVIVIDGHEYTKLSPSLSRKCGIGVIYQEFNLINELSIAENVFLGRPIRKGLIIDRKRMNNRTSELFEQLGIRIDPRTLVKNLTTGYQQLVEIIKALSMNTHILIMDEPSASLTNTELDFLFSTILRLKKEGVSIIYISHRLDEVFKISDRITVLRDGEHVGTVFTKETSRNQLVKMMVGRELNETYPRRKAQCNAETILEVQNLCGNGLKNVSLSVQRGEIVGLGGLIGAGRTELAELLFGVVKPTAGSILIRGKPIRIANARDAIDKGIALAPEDRKKQGILLHLSVSDNISLPILSRITKLGVIKKRKERQIVNTFRETLRIKTPNTQQKLKNLSGGNQQKVVLAKWLAAEPDIIIFDEPTRGIDVGAKHEIYEIIDQLAKSGKAIIMISSDMAELIGISDRIYVLAEGRITGCLLKKEFNQEVILEYASRC